MAKMMKMIIHIILMNLVMAMMLMELKKTMIKKVRLPRLMTKSKIRTVEVVEMIYLTIKVFTLETTRVKSLQILTTEHTSNIMIFVRD
jgi:hypothetical protein